MAGKNIALDVIARKTLAVQLGIILDQCYHLPVVRKQCLVMSSKGSRRIITVFDVDGVIVDNVEFEDRVADCLINEISARRGISYDVAAEMWIGHQRSTCSHSHWYDYGFHCKELGIGEAYKEAHWACSDALSLCEGIQQVVELAAASGPCWLATDASEWVLNFKLATLKVPVSVFEEKFHLTRCQASKGTAEYWRQVEQVRAASGFDIVFIDNRDDRLRAASAVLQQATFVHVLSEDHATKVSNAGSEPGTLLHVEIAEPDDLYETLERIYKRLLVEH